MGGERVTVSFANDISPIFKQYQGQMMWRFDLTSYDQVKENAELIWGRIDGGGMPPPPFQPFSADFLATYKAWMAAGCPE